MWCWRKMEKINWSEKVTNEQVLKRKGSENSKKKKKKKKKKNSVPR